MSVSCTLRVQEQQFEDTLLQRVTLFDQEDYKGLCFHDGTSLWQGADGSLSQRSPGRESAPPKLKGGMPLTSLAAGVSLRLWAHIHHLPGILLCTLYDGIQILLLLIELSPLPRGMIEARP